VSIMSPSFSNSFHIWSRPAVWVATLVMATCAMAVAGSPLQARDFFSSFFGGFFERRPPPSVQPPLIQFPFAPEFGEGINSTPHTPYGSGAAYCVRTCDGRYFPLSGSDNQVNATMCSSLCPASTTMVFYGNNISNAYSGNKSYSSLPNAFRYRNELVAGCTCNGKDPGGLAPIKVENDPTLRKGDVIAGGKENRFETSSSGSSRRGASANSLRGQRPLQRYFVDRQ
jgi:hypothetical protein